METSMGNKLTIEVAYATPDKQVNRASARRRNGGRVHTHVGCARAVSGN